MSRDNRECLVPLDVLNALLQYKSHVISCMLKKQLYILPASVAVNKTTS